MTSEQQTPVSEVLNRAADLIEERGWSTGGGIPGSDTQDGDKLCLEGGIMAALGLRVGQWGELWSCPAYEAVVAYLKGPDNPAKRLPFMWQDVLPMEQDENGKVLYRYVGGSRECAYAYGRAKVIEVLRATALIEAAKEDATPALPDTSRAAQVGAGR